MKTTNTEKSLKERKLAEFREKCNLSIGKGGFITMTPPYCLTETEMEQFISDMADEYEAKIDQTKRETVEKICDLIHEDVKKYHADALTDTFLNGKMWEAKELWERLTDLKSHLTDKK